MKIYFFWFFSSLLFFTVVAGCGNASKASALPKGWNLERLFTVGDNEIVSDFYPIDQARAVFLIQKSKDREDSPYKDLALVEWQEFPETAWKNKKILESNLVAISNEQSNRMILAKAEPISGGAFRLKLMALEISSGRRIRAEDSPDLEVVYKNFKRPISLLLLKDGSFHALILNRSGVRLLGYSPEGKLRANRLLMPASKLAFRQQWGDVGSLQPLAEDELFAVLNLEEGEREIFARHFALSLEPFEKMALLFMKLSTKGELLTHGILPMKRWMPVNIVKAEGKRGLISLLGTHSKKESFWEIQLFDKRIATKEKAFLSPESGTTLVRDFALLPSGESLVVGGFDYHQVSSGSFVKPGRGFLARLNREGKETGRHESANSRSIISAIRRSQERKFLILQIENLPLTHETGEGKTVLYQVSIP